MFRKGTDRVKLVMVRHPEWMPAECVVEYMTETQEAVNIANGYDCEEIPTVYFSEKERR